MKRSYQFGVVATALLVMIAAIAIPMRGGSPISGVRTKNLSNAKQLATACKIYAIDHEDRFPVHLSELEPDYIPKGALDQMRCSSMVRDGEAQILMDWLYFGAGFTDQNPPRLMIASPQATTTQPSMKRVIIEGDRSGRIINEADFLPLLAETVRQMQTQDQERRDKSPALSSPAAASPGSSAENATTH